METFYYNSAKKKLWLSTANLVTIDKNKASFSFLNIMFTDAICTLHSITIIDSYNRSNMYLEMFIL